jgi:GntR family transcriptional regulator, transcriptional repressor for pyruvate dehydrogenase complex
MILQGMSFQRIATKKKSVYVAEQIANAIRRGTYRSGDRLPPERVIAEQMAVSRPSVREALSALQIAGVLESRPGDGTYVTTIREAGDAVVSLLEQEESPVAALEARRLVERAIAQAAAVRMTPQSLSDLARALDALGQATRARDFHALSAANGPFHLAIVRVVGNELLEGAVRPLMDVMERRLAHEMRRRDYTLNKAFYDEIYRVHEDLYLALQSGDPVRAGEAMDRHFDVIETSLRT